MSATDPDPDRHGGRLIAARARYPEAPAPFIDLSTGINPTPYPLRPWSPAASARLPEPETEQALRILAASSYAAPSERNVLLAPGSQILISLLPTVLGCRRAAVLSPTYDEHEAAWRRAGAETTRVAEPAQLADHAAWGSALVLCNPNNPDGRRLDAAELRRLAARCATSGAVLVVDEAFADLEPELSCAASLLPCAGLVVLRSLGKSYGLAGLRLGFMLADHGLVRRMQALLGPWSVSGPALEAGLQALADEDWRARTTSLLQAAAGRMDRLLDASGLIPCGGTRLFRLAEAPDADALRHRLGRAGLLVRGFPHRPGWLRFGLPPDEAAWARLQQALLP